MQRFKNILSHVNPALEEHPAFSRGVRLPQHNNAKLTAMTVIGRRPIDLQSPALKEHPSRLKKFVTPPKQDGVRASTKVLVCHVPGLFTKRCAVCALSSGAGGLAARFFSLEPGGRFAYDPPLFSLTNPPWFLRALC